MEHDRQLEAAGWTPAPRPGPGPRLPRPSPARWVLVLLAGLATGAAVWWVAGTVAVALFPFGLRNTATVVWVAILASAVVVAGVLSVLRANTVLVRLFNRGIALGAAAMLVYLVVVLALAR